MTFKEGKKLLIELIQKYVIDEVECKNLINEINDHPGLPIRGIFEEIRKLKTEEFEENDKKTFSKLFSYFG